MSWKRQRWEGLKAFLSLPLSTQRGGTEWKAFWAILIDNLHNWSEVKIGQLQSCPPTSTCTTIIISTSDWTYP